MSLRAVSRLALMPAALALLLAACQPSAPDQAATPPAGDAAATAQAAPAPAEPITDEPALDPDAAPADAPAEAPADAAAAEDDAEAPPAPAAASAVTLAVEGEHYELIPGGQPYEPLDGKIEVVEVFNNVCPACAMFQPLVNN